MKALDPDSEKLQEKAIVTNIDIEYELRLLKLSIKGLLLILWVQSF